MHHGEAEFSCFLLSSDMLEDGGDDGSKGLTELQCLPHRMETRSRAMNAAIFCTLITGCGGSVFLLC
jgi:hypothetical protein